MPPADPLLFDPDDLLRSATSRSLVIQSTRERPLGKEERAFNRALARVQALSHALDEQKRRLDRLLQFHAAEIRPRVERAAALRAELVRALVPFLDDRRLTKGHLQVLRRILADQLDLVLSQVQTPAADLQALFERLHHVGFAQALQDDIEEERSGMEAMLHELGLDVDVPELHAGMTEAEAAVAAARLADDIRRAEESHDRATHARKKTKRELRDLEKVQRSEQLRKDNLGTLYRRLVRELHPDLEANPTVREKKSRIVQDVTAAHARGDLHALLRLELEWIDGIEADAPALSRDKLRAYTELLKEQARELDAEVQSLPFHPRYAPLIVDGPFGLADVIDGPGEVERLDAAIGQVQAGLDRLSSGEALAEVRGAIRDYREMLKPQSRSRRRL